MDYTNLSRAQLLAIIDELKMLNDELLSEKEQEVRLDFAWSGNLGHWYFNIKTGNIVFNPLKVTALGYRMDELPPLHLLRGLKSPSAAALPSIGGNP